MNTLGKLIAKLCPDGVEYKPLGEIGDFFSGMSGVSSKWADQGNCRFIEYMNVYENARIDVAQLAFATVKSMNQTSLQRGDVLFTAASEVPEECAIAGEIEDDIGDGVFADDHLFGLRIKPNTGITSGYLKYVFQSPDFKTQIKRYVRGVTRFYIAKQEFVKATIPIPPIPVQKEIVRMLDDMAGLIDTLEEELAVRKKQYEWYRDRLIGVVLEKKWTELLNVLSQPITDGPHETPKFVCKGIPFISVEAIENNQINFERKRGCISAEYDALCSKKYKPKMGDVFVVKSGSTIGKVAVVDFQGDFNIWSPLAAMRVSDNYEPKFLFYTLQTTYVQNEIRKNSSQGSQPNIGMRVLEKLHVPLTNLSEQRRIVKILDNFDTLCNSMTEGLPGEIALRKQQYEYYRDKLLTFKRKPEVA